MDTAQKTAIPVTPTKEIRISKIGTRYMVVFGQINEFGNIDLFPGKTKFYANESRALNYAKKIKSQYVSPYLGR